MNSAAGVVVTGGTGFLGRHVVAALEKADPKRPLLILGGRSGRPPSIDLTNKDSIQRALDGFNFDTVVHLAAQASVGQSIGSPADTWRANLVGSLNLAEVVADLVPSAAIIHAGTAESYGESFIGGTALTEDAPLLPLNAYARSKAAVELLLQDIRPQSAKLVLLRLFNHTGPGQDERFAAPSFAAQIARAEKQGFDGLIRVGDLSAKRDFGDVRDAARAIALVVCSIASLDFVSKFNICTGVSRPVSDVVETLIKIARVPIRITVDNDRLRPSSIPVAAGSYSSIRSALGWAPQASFEELMMDLLDHWRARV